MALYQPTDIHNNKIEGKNTVWVCKYYTQSGNRNRPQYESHWQLRKEANEI